MLIGWPEDGGMMSTTREEGKSASVGGREAILDPMRGRIEGRRTGVRVAGS
jgi:hypothetical protein